MLTIEAPELTTVGDNFYIRYDDTDTSQGQQIFFPKLQKIGDNLEVYGNGKCCNELTSISFLALTDVGGFVDIADIVTRGPLEVAFLKLKSVKEGFAVYNNPMLASVRLAALESVVGDFVVHNNFQLHTLTCPTLTTVGKALVVGNWKVDGNSDYAKAKEIWDHTKEIPPTSRRESISRPTPFSSVHFKVVHLSNQSIAQVDFTALRVVSTRLEMHGLGPIEILDLPSLDKVESLSVTSSNKLSAITVPLLTRLATDLQVTHNARLKLLDMPELAFVNGTSVSSYPLGALGDFEEVPFEVHDNTPMTCAKFKQRTQCMTTTSTVTTTTTTTTGTTTTITTTTGTTTTITTTTVTTTTTTTTTITTTTVTTTTSVSTSAPESTAPTGPNDDLDDADDWGGGAGGGSTTAATEKESEGAGQ